MYGHNLQTIIIAEILTIKWEQAFLQHLQQGNNRLH